MVDQVLAKEKERRQKDLEKCIYDLSEKFLDNDTEKREMALTLLELYKGGFRHNYSSFFPIILEISREDNQHNVDLLSDNLETLRDFVETDFVSGQKEFKALYVHLEKLCDHLNLEIARWSYYSSNEQKIKDVESKSIVLNEKMSNAEKELQKASEQATSIQEELSDAKEELKIASKKASSIQTELIAVLSIFAAVVVTFSGGFTFLGGVMTSVNEAKHYEAVALVAIICGMVIFNTIFLLMYMVGKIIDRNIYASCETPDCSCEHKCWKLNKIRKRLPYVFYFNLLCLVGIVVDFVIWYCDIRNWFGL